MPLLSECNVALLPCTGRNATVLFMRFHEYHALGDDYVVLDPKYWPLELPPAEGSVVCRRNFGTGSGGIFGEPLPVQDDASFSLRIINTIGIIYESRPNVTADAAGLCLKRGNAIFLRGSNNLTARIAKVFAGQGVGIGISTDKLQARRPVELEGLTSQKSVVHGDGSVRA